VIEACRRHYNAIRPHSSLGYRPPAPQATVWLPDHQFTNQVAQMPSLNEHAAGHSVWAGQPHQRLWRRRRSDAEGSEKRASRRRVNEELENIYQI
jgi:hypothetical protein